MIIPSLALSCLSGLLLVSACLARQVDEKWLEARDPASTKDEADSGRPLESQASVIGTTSSTFLVIALATSTQSQIDTAKSGLNDYGIPFQLLLVPNGNVTLPPLNSSATSGNYGGIVILSELSYSYVDSTGATIWTSALSQDQWDLLFGYQVAFGVRMVRLGAFPSNSGEQDSGTSSLGGCCDYNVENFMTISDTSQFKTAGLIQ
jgi:hypothetical protein